MLLLLVTAFAVFTWGILPRLDHYRPDVERLLSENTGYKAQIHTMTGRWDGLAPELTINGLRLSAGEATPAMTLQRVTLKPSWSSLTAWEPRFSLVRIDAPSLDLLRDKQQQFYLNGLPLSGGGGKGSGKLDDWLLRQQEVAINQVKIRWRDDYVGIDPIQLENGSLRLTRTLLSHRLQVQAASVSGFGKGVTLDAKWTGDDVHRWRDWSGEMSVSLESFRTGSWTRYLTKWVDWRQGNGGGSLALTFKKAGVTAAQGNLQLHDLVFTPQGDGLVTLPLLGGEFVVGRRGKDEWHLDAKKLDVTSTGGSIFKQAELSARYQPGERGGGEVTVDRINLTPLQPLLLALQAKTLPQLARWQPRGVLSAIKTGWDGAVDAPKKYQAALRFEQLGWNAVNETPGLSQLTGQVTLTEKEGTLTLNSNNSALNMPSLFKAALPLDSLTGQLTWALNDKTARIKINTLRFANKDLSAQLTGQYRYPGKGSGYADLAGRLERVNATAVPHYLPHIMNPNTLDWLNHAFKGGRVSTASLQIKGDLDQFPFKNGKGGLFKVDARLDKVDLNYGPGWPQIDTISGRMQFINQGMVIDADSGVTMGVPLKAVSVKIPDLDADDPILYADGKASGQLSRLLAFAAKNPTSPMLADFTGQLRGTGDANLGIKLEVPLNHSRDTKINGDVQLAGNGLVFTELPVPEARQISGKLHFTEYGVTTKGLKLSALGGNFTLDAMLDPKQRFVVEGEADSHAVVQKYVSVLEPFVSGRSRYKVQFTVGRDLDDLKLESTLAGTRLTAPAPARKQPGDAWPLLVTLRPGSGGWAVNYTLGQRSKGVVNLKKDGTLLNGVVGVGDVSLASPQNALAIRVAASSVDLTPWVGVFSGGGAGGKSTGNLTTPLQIELNSNTVAVYGRELHAVKATLRNNIAARSWAGTLEAREIGGSFEYFTAGNGLLKARLPKLEVGLSRTGVTKTGKKLGADSQSSNFSSLRSNDLPALDITVDQLRYRGNDLGRLNFTAQVIGGGHWQMPSLKLNNSDGSLRASLVAYGGSSQRVESEFTIESGNIGGLLDRFGYKNAVTNGKGTLTGKLGWPGRLQDFEENQLSGNVSLEAHDGRFSQVDPGAARLLGVLSLQSLARRAKFDFSDIFGSGFAYDHITGTAQATRGIFRSNNLYMTGPSANVAIQGQVDLNKNSQNLQVRVEPHLSGSVALTAGAATLNPLVGLAALAAQKVMRNPFDKMLAIEYDITGTFDDPVVQKKGIGQRLTNGGAQESSAPIMEKTQ